MYSLSAKQKYKNVAFYDLTFPTLHSGPSIFIMTVTLHVSKLSNQTTYVDIMLMLYFIITVRNKVAKVMFLHLSVILFTGGMVCLSACWDTTPREAHPPRKCTHPPPQKHTLPGSTPPGSTPPGNHPLPQGSTPPRKDPLPLGSTPPRKDPPPPGRRLPLRTVRILLECIVVLYIETVTISSRRPTTLLNFRFES